MPESIKKARKNKNTKTKYLNFVLFAFRVFVVMLGNLFYELSHKGGIYGR